MIEIRWDWIASHLDDIAEKTWQHLQLLVIPMVAGFLIAFGLALLAMRRPGTDRTGDRDHRTPLYHPQPGRLRGPATPSPGCRS